MKQYHGIDFSSERILYAQRVCPEFSFTLEDAFKSTLYEKPDYDAVLCTEFLEHVNEDWKILENIRSGTLFYGTVPNFPFTSHVRYFTDISEVEQRYKTYFNCFSVDYFPANRRGKVFFLIEGVKI